DGEPQGKVFADDGVAYCLDAASGSLVWKVDAAPTDEKMLGTGRFMSLWPLRTGVMVHHGIAYFTAGLFPSEGIYFLAVDAADGKILWRRQLDQGGVGCPSPQGYLLASDDSIYMTSRTAPARWSMADGSRIGLETPIPHHEYRFHNGGSYAQLWGENIVYGQAAILAYDPNKTLIDKYNRPKNGDLLFHWFGARRVLFHGDLAYFATDDHLLAVDQKLLPELAKAECREFEAAYKRHRVADYLTALEALAEYGEESPMGRRLQETSLKWGKEKFEQWPAVAEKLFAKFARKCRWMTRLKATEAMILAGDVIYAGGEADVFAIDARTGRQLWTDQTASRVRGLAVANGRLLVSTIDGRVRCYQPGRSTGEPNRVLGPPKQPVYGPGRFTSFLQDTVRAIVDDSGADRGYCLVVGGGNGQLAYEIARETKLNVYVLESDAEKVRQARALLSVAGLYGGRITVLRMTAQQRAAGRLPFPPYVFNLVVDQGAFLGGPGSVSAEELFRVCKPCGGVVYTGQPPGGKVVRGRVVGSRDWTHNYATPANTYCSEDPLVKGPFGILWYGEPGPRQRIERHAAGPMPLVSGSTMFLTGYDRVMAYDIYNGLRLWQRTLLGATRTGLPLAPSNIVADERSLFVVIADRTCLRLDATTGRTLQTYEPPGDYWGWIAQSGNLLFGSQPVLDEARRKPDLRISEAVFAVDTETGRLRWKYEGQGIEHGGIAVADGTLFLLDRNLTEAERRRALDETIEDTSVENRRAVDNRGNPIPADLRKLVALNADTGNVRWQRPINVTDVTLDDTVVSAGRVAAACMVKDGVVVVHGTGSLGHPYREFLRGEFARRAMFAFATDTGRFLWGGRRNYRKRPIIVGDSIYAEPHAWNLKTGEPKMYIHPLSGRQEPLNLFRGYIGCSHLLGSGAALFGNRNGIAHQNLDDCSGYTPLGNMSLACGLGAVPAGGLFVAPEGRSGCTCATPIFTSIALVPRRKARAWSLGIPGDFSKPVVTPVRHVAINLAAPGFRQDDHGRLWIPYPSRGGQGILGDWLPTYQHDASMCYRHGDDLLSIEGTDTPWVFTSGYAHAKPLEFRLIEPDGQPARYTVRLYFAEPEDLAPGQRVFDVSLQGEKVLENFDIVQQAGGPRKALVKEFPSVSVSGTLTVSLTPAAGCPKRPILSGLEAVRE
ncbi:MAG: PQQ-binding-like beta-propeller repeat protein, partial [Planctomycetes bacterium]|nr:PQQ-binding-like beta-propeller repeat protein [Planctomycetota bacterium]